MRLILPSPSGTLAFVRPQLPSHGSTTIFVLDELYESPAGVVEHWKQAVETWRDLPAFMAWTADYRRN
jgi:hypothetical protein